MKKVMSDPLLQDDDKKRETIDHRDSFLTRLSQLLGMFTKDFSRCRVFDGAFGSSIFYFIVLCNTMQNHTQTYPSQLYHLVIWD